MSRLSGGRETEPTPNKRGSIASRMTDNKQPRLKLANPVGRSNPNEEANRREEQAVWIRLIRGPPTKRRKRGSEVVLKVLSSRQ